MGYLLCHSLCFELPVIVGRNLCRNSSPLIQCLWFEFVPKMSGWSPKSFHNLPPCFLLTSRSSMRNHAKGGGFAFCAFLTLDCWIFVWDNRKELWLLSFILLRSLSLIALHRQFFQYLYSGTVRSYALDPNSVHLFNYISGQGQLYLTKCCSVRSAVFGTAVLSVSTSNSIEVWALMDLHPSATHYATMTAKLLFNGNLERAEIKKLLSVPTV